MKSLGSGDPALRLGGVAYWSTASSFPCFDFLSSKMVKMTVVLDCYKVQISTVFGSSKPRGEMEMIIIVSPH